MIKVITFIITCSFNIIISFAQVKSEKNLIKNKDIQLPKTLTYTKKKSPLIIWVHGSRSIDKVGGTSKIIEQLGEKEVKHNTAFFKEIALLNNLNI